MHNTSILHRRTLLRTLAQAVVLASAGTLAACQDRSTTSSAPEGDADAAAGEVLTGRQAYEAAAGASGFAVGALMAAQPVYVFFDPNCPHCGELWKAAKPLLGKLKMVWIPVALLGKTSGPLGATLLAAADPAKAMDEHEVALLGGRGGIAVNSAVGAEVSAKVQANTQLFRRLNADSVPLIVFKHARTGAYSSNAGALGTPELAALVGV